MKTSLFGFFVCCACLTSAATPQNIVVTVANDLDIARPSEVIAVPWKDIAALWPGTMIQHLEVRDSTGRILPYQVTNIAPLEPKGTYGDLLFQHDFAAGEKSATFTIARIDAVSPPFPAQTFARYVPERLDDFAWENDRIGHRIYGPALAAKPPPGSRRELTANSGVDVWVKRVRYLVVDRWYNKGQANYHTDQGEGLDMYKVGYTRGCGGTGIWDGKTLFVSENYRSWKVLANGPIRTIFEVTYAPWDAGGVSVSEVKRFTVDAGHNLDSVESTFTFAGPQRLTVAIGLAKHKEAKSSIAQKRDLALLSQWEVYPEHGALGTAAVLPEGALAGFADDDINHLILTEAVSGRPVRYLIGAGWDQSGDFPSTKEWNAYLAAAANRLRSPVRITSTEGR